MKNVYIVLINTGKAIFIMATDDNYIHAFKTQKEALNYFEDGYQTCHKRSYESSMSACINYIGFRPRVIFIPNLDFVKNHIGEKVPRLMNLRSVAGFMKGITTCPEAKKYWEKGIEPRLIKEPV
jgi:hypothetical protein